MCSIYHLCHIKHQVSAETFEAFGNHKKSTLNKLNFFCFYATEQLYFSCLFLYFKISYRISVKLLLTQGLLTRFFPEFPGLLLSCHKQVDICNFRLKHFMDFDADFSLIAVIFGCLDFNHTYSDQSCDVWLET